MVDLCVFVFFAEISLPNEQARLEIIKIHAAPIAKHGEIGKELNGQVESQIFATSDSYFVLKMWYCLKPSTRWYWGFQI